MTTLRNITIGMFLWLLGCAVYPPLIVYTLGILILTQPILVIVMVVRNW